MNESKNLINVKQYAMHKLTGKQGPPIRWNPYATINQSMKVNVPDKHPNFRNPVIDSLASHKPPQTAR